MLSYKVKFVVKQRNAVGNISAWCQAVMCDIRSYSEVEVGKLSCAQLHVIILHVKPTNMCGKALPTKISIYTTYHILIIGIFYIL